MRVLQTMALIAIVVLSSAANAQDKAAPEAQSRKAPPSRQSTAEESAALARTARNKAEALERVRDRRMRAISKGICTGC
ncbi:hypothetical protein [Microvirga yunnanensis]|uniref:hypothetical protein n=1 Tax=Microvirga yunnanensis TaxID=2953740 RepID=UPI0021C6E664|nr:hypothetical protein [Microvirga sp. HBU65207]